MNPRPTLLFVSPRFLFPADSGGKIRTTQILRGMKEGLFEIVLCSPEPLGARESFREEIGAVCDRFVGWRESRRLKGSSVLRLRHLLQEIPVSVVTDRSRQGRKLVAEELRKKPDLVVFDFPHSLILAPEAIEVPSVLFTHNIEAEIFKRHAAVVRDPVRRRIWNNQYEKMKYFESSCFDRVDTVIAVSERDARSVGNGKFSSQVEKIPTGVDLSFFEYDTPDDDERVVFTGAMDWAANIDGVEFFLESVWPRVVKERPSASVKVVGRNPPAYLVRKHQGLNCVFTGFVPDVRPYVRGSAAFIIPLRVGGGTRVKAYEAMAQGSPIVSTRIGIEGLPLVEGEHFLLGDTAVDFAASLIALLADKGLRLRLSRGARKYVQENFSDAGAVKAFEEICLSTLARCKSV